MARRWRGLTPEDAELWARVARSATPLAPAPRAPEPKALPKAPTLPRPPELASAARAVPAPTPRRGLVSHSLAPTPAEALGALPLRMDTKLHRKLSSGKLRPEARLDLHGMTLAEAHAALIGFVRSSHARGLRLLLVITGKGSRQSEDAPWMIRPGALRHNVPHWLVAAPLGVLVQQVTPASRRHGGEGAYYVYLRRPGRA
ncbi:MAG: Smr/MutS family protein [Paracoccus sp. (in: a-proteobacteria)]|nr:Smr/MutS family protein [Paracoccus sp. (in: a-proteobacteria)]